MSHYFVSFDYRLTVVIDFKGKYIYFVINVVKPFQYLKNLKDLLLKMENNNLNKTVTMAAIYIAFVIKNSIIGWISSKQNFWKRNICCKYIKLFTSKQKQKMLNS